MNGLVKTRKLGGSLIVTLPKALVEQEGLQADQLVFIDVKKAVKSGFGLTRDLPPLTADSRLRGQLDEIRD